MTSTGDESLFSDRLRTSLLPVIIGLMGPIPHPDPDRVVLVNPATQGMVVLRGDASAISEMLLSDGSGAGGGAAPASKEAIEAMRSVDSSELDAEQECAVCLDELTGEEGIEVKEMPCKHRFHGVCIEKWLKMHGSCPLCRYEMPKEEGEENKERRRQREVWVTISFRRRERGGEDGDGDHQEEES